MQAIVFLITAITLFGSTFAIYALDKRRAASRPPITGPEGYPVNPPEMSIFVALLFLCNIGALPYYFYASRRTAGGFFLGVGAFLVCMALTLIVQVVVVMALGGPRAMM
jgi:hypothetical protein